MHKSGSKSNVSNYRPILNQPIFSKIPEKAMFNRLIRYLDKYEMFSEYQFGFRPKMLHGAYMPIMNLIHIVTTNFESHKHTIWIFIDLKKAFDIVDHEIFL